MRLGLSSGLSHIGFVGGVSPIDPATLNPYLYFRADPAAGGSITTAGGAVSSWSQVTTSGGNQINRTLGQGTANQQPQHDNSDKHVTFDESDDDLNFVNSSGVNQSITQAGIWFAATKRGVWAQEIDNGVMLTVDALGPDKGFPKNEDVYAITLLPNTLTDSQIEGVVLWLLENTSAGKVTDTDLGSYRRSQNSMLRMFSFGLDTSSTTGFNVMFYGASKLTAFPDIDTSSGTSFNFLCYNCTSLTSIPQLDVSNGTSFAQAWYNCESLTSFPLLDFSSATSLNLAWGECTSLTSFPAIDASSTTNFQQAWTSCTGLTSFGLVDTSSGTNFKETWRSCTNLTSFPAIDTSSGTDFSLAWYNCNSITSFPTLDVSNGTEFRFTWGEMRSLTAFPVLDTSKGEDFEYSWYNCISLTSFPSININKGKDFRFAWQLCTSLTTFPANFFDSWNPDSIADNVFQHTWDQCVLTATSVENILVSLAASGKHGTANGASGGTALSNAVIDIDYNASTGSLTTATNTAITTLKSRSWGIKINGVAQ